MTENDGNGVTTGRTWADLVAVLPKYLIVVILIFIAAMVVRAELSDGITSFGFLGQWGKPNASSDTVSDEISALEIRLECVSLELQPLANEINGWKNYMQITAETTSNAPVRHSRTEVWFGDVDDVTGKISEVVQIANGQRSNC